MTVAVKPAPRITQANGPLLYRLTLAQYQRMVELGILTDKHRVELIEGLIVEKMPHNPPHDATVTRITRRLLKILPEEWLLRSQSAFGLKDSAPEPDFAIVRGPEAQYFSRHPTPRDLGLVIEVADSTLLNDRRFKARLYARARIPEYWIVNVVDKVIEVYTQPKAGKRPGYMAQRNYGMEEAIPLILDGQEIQVIPVGHLLP